MARHELAELVQRHEHLVACGHAVGRLEILRREVEDAGLAEERRPDRDARDDRLLVLGVAQLAGHRVHQGLDRGRLLGQVHDRAVDEGDEVGGDAGHAVDEELAAEALDGAGGSVEGRG